MTTGIMTSTNVVGEKREGESTTGFTMDARTKFFTNVAAITRMMAVVLDVTQV